MEAKVIFNEIYGERELIVNPIWNWVYKWDHYDKVIARRKATIIKDAPNYELLFSEFKESYIKELVDLAIMYDKAYTIEKFFDSNEVFDTILLGVDIIVNGDSYHYSIEVIRTIDGDIVSSVKSI